MKIVLDFFPIALFATAYYLSQRDLYVATAVLMAATSVQSAILYAKDRKLEPMQQAVLTLVLVAGSLTLILHDERFIKWKPTVLYGAMALVLALAQIVWKKNYLKILLGTQLKLPDLIWKKLTVAWVAYLAFMAAANAYVVVTYSTDTWVNFKIWGFVFPIAFILGQGLFIAKHLQDDEEPAPHD